MYYYDDRDERVINLKQRVRNGELKEEQLAILQQVKAETEFEKKLLWAFSDGNEERDILIGILFYNRYFDLQDNPNADIVSNPWIYGLTQAGEDRWEELR